MAINSSTMTKTVAKPKTAKKPKAKVQSKDNGGVKLAEQANKTTKTTKAPAKTAPKNKKTKVLFAISEAAPFIKTGGLGDVGGSLPKALKKAGADTWVVLPKFSTIDSSFTQQMEFLGSVMVPLSWRNQYCGVYKLSYQGVTYFFLDNEYYFHRSKLYGELDDSERMAFFSKAILESIPLMGEGFPDVIHCHDWHTAMVNVFLREDYNHLDGYKDIKTVFTVHNLKFQGVFPLEIMGDVLGLSEKDSKHQLMQGDAVNYMQGALLYSDYLTTVSPTYSHEIKNSYFGEDMEGIFENRSSILSGILNGIDLDLYNPKKDSNIAVNYGISTLQNKTENKLALQAELGLTVDKDIPLIVMISRLTTQKGMDLVVHILEELVNTHQVQIAVLGTGDKEFHHDMEYFASKYPEKISAQLTFDTPLSHRMYAGGDMLLMPSNFEPCGLSQMIAMTYGTLPIVRETGGLNDSVTSYNKYTGEGNGFSFKNYNAHELLFAIKDGLDVYYNDKKAWVTLQKSAMRADFKWDASAGKYLDIYKKLTER